MAFNLIVKHCLVFSFSLFCTCFQGKKGGRGQKTWSASTISFCFKQNQSDLVLCFVKQRIKSVKQLEPKKDMNSK